MLSTPKAISWARILLGISVIAAVCVGGWYAVARGKTAGESGKHGEDSNAAQTITAEVMHPKVGGIQRICLQPGTLEPFDSADIYAKVSGFLVEQTVDIGSKVNAGDLLARISVPEYEKEHQRDLAKVKAAEAKVSQMKAHIAVAVAEARAAEASVILAKVLVRAKTAYKEYRSKQLARVKELVAKNAVDERLRDEQEDYYLSALEAENAAMEQVNTAKEKSLASASGIKQAEADLEQSTAEVGVAIAELAKSQVLLDYMVIRSPFTGVVTKRNFLPGKDGRYGDFIKAADQGGIVPMLAVERTDLMRVVVQVPDRDVPYLSANATAVVEIDSLPRFKFDKNGSEMLKVSRWAKAEDDLTRTMRTEIDLQNPDGILSHGMYGRVKLTLSSGTPDALRIPSSALIGKAEGGRGSVRVVRDGKVHFVPVRFATDNGVEVEIVSGITATDQVMIRVTSPVEEGTPVTVHEEQLNLPVAGH